MEGWEVFWVVAWHGRKPAHVGHGRPGQKHTHTEPLPCMREGGGGVRGAHPTILWEVGEQGVAETR